MPRGDQPPSGALLDLGSGSGVVVVRGPEAGLRAVLGVDIDPVAVHAAAGNAALNGLSPTFLVGDATAPGYALPSADTVAPTSPSTRSCGSRGASCPAPRGPRPSRGRCGSCSPACSSSRASRRRPHSRVRDGGPSRRRHVAHAAPEEGSVTSVATVFVGCKVSQADGEDALAELVAAGLRPASARGAADVVVVHTCCATAEAERKSRRLVRRVARDGRRVVVAGCAAALRPEQFDGPGRGGRGAAGLGDGGGGRARMAARRRRAPLRARRCRRRGRRARFPPDRHAHASRAQGPGRLFRSLQLLRRASGARAAAQHVAARRPRGRPRRRRRGLRRARASAASTSAPGATTTCACRTSCSRSPSCRASRGCGSRRWSRAISTSVCSRRWGIRAWRVTCTCRCSRPTTGPCGDAPALHVRAVRRLDNAHAGGARRLYAQHRRDRRLSDRGRRRLWAHARGPRERPVRARARVRVLVAAGDGGSGAADPAGRARQGAHGPRAGGRRGGRPVRAPRRAGSPRRGARRGAARGALEGVQFGVRPLTTWTAWRSRGALSPPWPAKNSRME